MLALEVTERIANELRLLQNSPENMEIIERATKIIGLVTSLPIRLNLWLSQNIAFKIAETSYKPKKNSNDKNVQAWIKAFKSLCELIGIRLE